MVKVKLYTKTYCPYCHAALDFFKEHRIKVENIDVTDDETPLKEIADKTNNHKTVPQIFINYEFIGGTDELFQKYEAGELDKILKN